MDNPNWKEDRERRICFKTEDDKYAIKSYLNSKNVVEYMVFEYDNPIENCENTYRGSINDCKKYLKNKGYDIPENCILLPKN
ncbi:MAG: hypothetical protein DCC88_11730 [Spirobacillus cienkowskii]|jgi:hypothetical protein|uniref:Uncharacterized protein n=1 Tax=Spirobacillus cienkowskii TaxID=495820 RepID=A0A369KTQ3_9BACT|nr:MAG: hypothetical protein DCC88_11730 [Spirobacillus cienkowskii]